MVIYGMPLPRSGCYVDPSLRAPTESGGTIVHDLLSRYNRKILKFNIFKEEWARKKKMVIIRGNSKRAGNHMHFAFSGYKEI